MNDFLHMTTKAPEAYGYLQEKSWETSHLKVKIINDWMVAHDASANTHVLLSIFSESSSSAIEEHFVLVSRYEAETPYIDLKRLIKQYPNLHINIGVLINRVNPNS